MFRKKILAVVFAFILVCTMSITAFTIFADSKEGGLTNQAATNVNDNSDDSSAQKAEEPEKDSGKAGRKKFFNKFSRDLTDEEKAELKEKFKAKREEMKKKFEDMKNKWNSLTDEQKNEIYGLKDKIADLEKQLADKYRDFGIIDGETAEKIKNRIAERSEQMKKNGRIPFFSKRHGKC